MALGSKKSFINHPFLKPDKLLKRKYQQDLFITATKSNCLVVIPTGLGKTIVALLLAIHRLKDPETKVIFLAPTRPLVEQHQRTFKNLTTLDDLELVMMTGSTQPEKRKILYEDARCLFLTPQILQNDIIRNFINLKDVGLIIFDEAHRAVGNYSYTFIAEKYFSQATNPKVLAITASPGKNREKIQEVMENLHLNDLEIRTDSDPDVKPYIQDVKMVTEKVELPDEFKRIKAQIEGIQTKLHQELVDNDLLDTAKPNEVSRKTLLKAGKVLDIQIRQAQNDQDLRRLLFCKKVFSNAIRLSHMAELLEAQGLKSLKNFIDKNLEEVANGNGGKSLAELFTSSFMGGFSATVNTLVKKGVDHPKMAKLFTLLDSQFNSNEESRILVFCQFRDTVNTIVTHVNANPNIRAAKFIGQQKRGKEKGLSQKDQITLLDDFRSGEINTLVATSVAEEGLDIAECDVVIFYDVIPSEIRTIQRRGRTGRNKSGQVVILRTTGTREDGYFWAEKHREREMKRVLGEFQRALRKSRKKSTQKNQGKNLTDFMKKGQTIALKDKNSDEKSHMAGKEPSPKKKPVGILDNLMAGGEKPSVKPDPQEMNEDNPPFKIDKFHMANPDQPYMMVDSRETASQVVRSLSQHNINMDLQVLTTGDYILSERVGVERKSMPDLVSSIKDGRLFKELMKLKNQFSTPILILEGPLGEASSISQPALLGAFSSIMIKLRIFIYQTQSPEETAEILISLAKKEQNENKKPFSIRFKKAPEKISDQLEYILAGIPGINVSRAKDLLAEFKTLQNLFNASEGDLKKTPNIGPKLAKTIQKFAKSQYQLEDFQNDKEKKNPGT